MFPCFGHLTKFLTSGFVQEVQSYQNYLCGIYISVLGVLVGGWRRLIVITCFSVFPCLLMFFFSSHALTVSLGLCQRLSSGEISLTVVVCV